MLHHLSSHLPASARDVRRNLQILERDTSLDPLVKWAVILASASATESVPLIVAVRAAGKNYIPLAVEDAVQAAATTVALQGVYERLARMDEHNEYAGLPVRLDTSAADDPPIDMTLFELCCLAVMAVTGPVASMRDYEIALRHRGVTKQTIQDVVRVAAIMNSASVAIATAGAFKADPSPKRGENLA